jgi:hypothetical protein
LHRESGRAFDFTVGLFYRGTANCYGATGGRVLELMGNSQGRDNVKKRRARRKKTERLALAKRKQKAAK